MAEIQNAVELPKEDAAVAVAEGATTETTTAPALAVEDQAAEENNAEGIEDKAAEEIKPVEEGHLAHKAQGASFPKNLIPTKEFFFFGTEAVEPKALSAYLRSEKNTETAHHNASWASHTGNGLLFVGDKKAPTNVINLADTTEPETDGSTKFHFTHKGAKHSFKAASTAERDSWVAQLKTKIAEAKELAPSVTESEAYKSALESLKPAPKEEAPVEEAKPEDAPKTEEAAATTEGDAATTEEKPVEEPKRRSVSRKRASIFGFGRKESSKDKKDETKAEETPAAEAEAVVPAAEPAAEALKAEETPATEGDAAPAEEKAVESPKPTASKRNSFFGAVFAKKEKKPTETKPTEEVADEAETTDAAAPVIPPVESASPINAEEVAAAETTEATPAASTETPAKKDVKEKRKSSLPFAFGRREKSPAPAEGEEKRQTQSPFSKLRATIKSKTGAKADDKTVEETVKEESEAAETAAPAVTEEAVVAEPAQVAETEADNTAETVAPATTVTAAA
ncbi:hypothetical protein E4U41_005407 [Claviceps citrina]|nr:hypothetical protein E4U41_005407 [Claviceps citrina]